MDQNAKIARIKTVKPYDLPTMMHTAVIGSKDLEIMVNEILGQEYKLPGYHGCLIQQPKGYEYPVLRLFFRNDSRYIETVGDKNFNKRIGISSVNVSTELSELLYGAFVRSKDLNFEERQSGVIIDTDLDLAIKTVYGIDTSDYVYIMNMAEMKKKREIAEYMIQFAVCDSQMFEKLVNSFGYKQQFKGGNVDEFAFATRA